ncbi:MAG: ATPase, T2SS/T4P/T4SS family [Candidatus Hadarchaeales archaeon]
MGFDDGIGGKGAERHSLPSSDGEDCLSSGASPSDEGVGVVEGWELIPTDYSHVVPERELVEDLSTACRESFRAMGTNGFLLGEEEKKNRIREVVSSILRERGYTCGRRKMEELVDKVYVNLFGLSGLETYLSDPEVTEIMVNSPHDVFVERNGRLERASLSFGDEGEVRRLIERIFSPLNQQLDWLHPYADGYLEDGSRVHAVIPPISQYPVITIRKHREKVFSPEELVETGFISPQAMALLLTAVRGRANLVISGGTNTGKTTLMNTLSTVIEEDDRVITIEERFEADFSHINNRVAMQCRPPSVEGGGEVTIRNLVKQALRMRPTRIVIGECRQEEVFDLLQALNTGHEGSMTTLHAESSFETITRMVDLALLNPSLSSAVTREDITKQVMRAIDLIVFLRRLPDGRRRVSEILEVVGEYDFSLRARRGVSHITVGSPGGSIRLVPYDESIFVYGFNPLFEYDEATDTLRPVGIASNYLEEKLRTVGVASPAAERRKAGGAKETPERR